ncbi:hypothetical protein CIB84_014224 [Bambusicola thoracicus]
MPDLL